MKVYPWRERDNQGDRKMVMRVATSSAAVFRIVGGLLSLGTASLTGLVLVRRFANRNDSWVKRGLYMSLIGLVAFIVLGGPAAWAGALNNALLSFGDKVEVSTTSSLIAFIVRSIAFGFFFQGFAVMMASYVYEVTGSRFLDRVKPTMKMKRRFKKNEAALIQNDKPDEKSISFGLIVDDPIPWRTARYGKICARPMDNIGHGVVVGGTGTGKTVTALSLAYQGAVLDAAVFYIDFKASLRTLNALKKAAAKAGKKFYSFDLGTGSTETSWYDPLDWKGTSSEKASMVVNSLQFSEDGDAAYYRGQANDWLIFQFDVIEEVGLYPGESSFDFLLATTNPATMKDRLSPLRSGDARQKDKFKELNARADAGNMKDLTALRQNLSIVVNSGGERLRPQTDAPAILMSRAVEEGAVVYFGLSPATDLVALKTIGSLILRNLGVLSGERMREANLGTLRPVITLVDEASRLQDRAVVLDNVLATAREAEIFLWMITQSFSTWPKSTIVEMTTNVWTYVAFRVQDTETAETLVSTLEDVPTLEEMTEDRVKHRAFQGDVKERSGDARTTVSTGPFLTDAPMGITSMEDLHAYVWFTGSWTRATIEKWTPKRLKKPDVIRNDAPLVRAVFLDYESEAEPIQGTTFSELVTSADEITYNMENTTLKRTRRESISEDDYSNIHLPGAVGDGVQWGDAPMSGAQGYGPDEGRVNEMGGPSNQGNAEPAWDDGGAPRWADSGPSNGGEFAQDGPQGGDDVSWDNSINEVESDEPPVSHFYRGGSKAHSGRSESAVPAPAPSPQSPEFAQDAPDEPTASASPEMETPVASEGVDEDGLLWDDAPVPQSPSSAPEAPAPTPTEESAAPVASAPAEEVQGDDVQWGGTPADESLGATGNTGGQEDAVPVQEDAPGEEGGDVDADPAYTGSSSHDTNTESPVGATPSPDTETPVRPKRAPEVRSGQESTSPATSTPGTTVSNGEAQGTGDAQGTPVESESDPEGQKGEEPEVKKPAAPKRKAPSRKSSKSGSKKNASDDWL